jgi:hypothetical protein
MTVYLVLLIEQGDWGRVETYVIAGFSTEQKAHDYIAKQKGGAYQIQPLTIDL